MLNDQPETLPQLYRQTADVLERLEKGEKVDIQGKSYPYLNWSGIGATNANDWRFLREKPAEKTPEQLRVEANLALKAEWEKANAEGKPFKVQFRDVSCGDNPSAWKEATPAWADWCEYRRKPTPVIVPWTFEDQICGMVVERKNTDERRIVSIQWPAAVLLSGGLRQEYGELLRDWQQVDGKPCGKEQG